MHKSTMKLSIAKWKKIPRDIQNVLRISILTITEKKIPTKSRD